MGLRPAKGNEDAGERGGAGGAACPASSTERSLGPPTPNERVVGSFQKDAEKTEEDAENYDSL